MFMIVCFMIGGSRGELSLDRRANVARRADNDTYYNIYTKINTLEKYVSNLETKLQTRTKLLQQVLKSVIEMDSNLGSEKSRKNQKKEKNLTSKQNGNSFPQKVNFDSLYSPIFKDISGSDFQKKTSLIHNIS